jgi:5-methylcytosine-specific restriction protein A
MLARILTHVVRTVRSKIKDAKTKRSSKWPHVEKTHLAAHPGCAACGSNSKLNVHHKKPFHLNPALELDPTNLITMCMEMGKHCHLLIGHGNNFKAYNPNVEADAAYALQFGSMFEVVAERAKQNRRFA